MRLTESDRHAAAVLAVRYPHVPNLGDLTAVDWVAVPPADLITAGWPGQDISCAGPGAGIKKGSRSGLRLDIAGGLGQLRPAYVYLHKDISDVYGCIAFRGRYSARLGRVWRQNCRNGRGHSGVRIIRISSLVSAGASRSLPGQRPTSRQPSRA